MRSINRMIKSTSLKNSLFMRACRGEKTERLPVWLMRQAGRYQKSYRDLRSKVSMLELCKTSHLIKKVTVAAVEELDVDAAIIFSDLLLILEPMGFHLEYLPSEGPKISPPISSPEDVEKMPTPELKDSLHFVYDSIKETRSSLPENIPLLGFAGAPFTLASYLIEGQGSKNYIKTKSFMYQYPKSWHKLLSKLADALIIYLNRQIEAGTQAVQIFDSWVGCLSPDDYENYVLPHSQKVFKGLPPDVPSIHFGTQTQSLIGQMKKAGGTVMGLDWRSDLKSARQCLGDIPVMGNLDPAVLFSSKDEIRRQVQFTLKKNENRPGFIFNLGHGILPGTPYENVLYLVKTVKELST